MTIGSMIRSGPAAILVSSVISLLFIFSIPADSSSVRTDTAEVRGGSPEETRSAEEADQDLALAKAAQKEGSHEKALTLLRGALETYLALGAMQKAADTYREMGISSTNLAQYEEAEDLLRASIGLRSDLEDEPGLVRDSLALGNCYFKSGFYHEARARYAEANRLSRKHGEITEEMRSLLGLGIQSIATGYYDEAEVFITDAIEMARQNGKDLYRAIGHHNLGVVGMMKEDYSGATSNFLASAELKGSLGQPLREGLTRVTLAEIYLRQDDLERADRQIEAAFEIFNRFDSPRDQAYAFLISGDISTARGDAEASAGAYQTAETIARDHSLPEIMWRVLYREGMQKEHAADLASAFEKYAESIDVIEDLRGRLKVGQDKAHFLEDKMEVYEAMIRALVDAGRHEDAFRYVESAKCQVLKELLSRAHDDGEGGPSELPRTMNVEEIQGLLPADGLLIEYFTLPDKILAFVLSRSKLNMVSKTISRQSLQKDVERFVEALAGGLDGDGDPDFLMTARDLYSRLLFDTPEISGEGKYHVFLVPHAFLHNLPFCALKDGEKWLVERYVLSTAPSASTLFISKPVQQKQGEKDVLFVHNSRDGLNFTERERRIVSQYYPLLVSLEMEEEFKERAPQFDIIHVATHGNLNPANPMTTYLSLVPGGGEDGRLTVDEIMRLRLQADLVVLSACRSGVSKVFRGDDVVGLMGAFLGSGSSSVLATLWDIDDGAASSFIRLYYHYLKERDKAEAMQMAQIDFIQGKRAGVKGYDRPFCWAPFFLSGSLH